MNGLDEEKIHQARLIRTAAKNKNQWLENVQKNAPRIRRDLNVLWNDKGYGETIVVAAGPSLADDIEKLKAMRSGKEVVAVDAAYKFCVENGVQPEFVISTDASEKIVDMLAGGSNRVSQLILNVMAHPRVAEEWDGEIFWFVMANNYYDKDRKSMIQALHQLASKVGVTLNPGGNVSSIALAFALSVRNAEKVHLFGFDFCWKNDMYCGGRMKDLERQRLDSEMKAGTVFEVENTKGEKVLTNLSLKKFAEWHESIISKARNRVVNCTSSSILRI